LTGFFRDLGSNPFLLTGLFAGLLASIACGIVGPFVITRRIVFLAGAIAHIAIGGVGAAIFLAYRFPESLGWLEPIHGAAVISVVAAIVLAVLYQQVHERIDTIVGALWATGMAIGLLLIKFTPGYQTELMSYLFGNIAFVDWGSLRLMIVLDLVIVATVIVWYKRFLAICLDAEQAELQGISLLATHIVLLVLVALTVIVLTQVVGLILVIALLSLPAATVAQSATRLTTLIWWSIALSAALTTVPRIAVYGTRVSPEAAIVLAAGAAYLVAVINEKLRREHGAQDSTA
jgi:zinc transport system permease protein